MNYTEFAPGFRHSVIDGTTSDFGPVHINVLRIILSKVHMKCVDAREMTTDPSELACSNGVIAAISGGFFLYSEPDIIPPSVRTDPVGLLISEGCVVGPPIFHRAAIVPSGRWWCDGYQRAGSIRINKVGMEGVECKIQMRKSTRFWSYTIGHDGVRCVHRGNAEEVVIDRIHFALSIVGTAVSPCI
jgi:hypothetical protein